MGMHPEAASRVRSAPTLAKAARVSALAPPALAVLALGAGCGANAGNGSLGDVGIYGGSGSFAGGDASDGLDVQVEQNGVAVAIVRVGCAGDCADVQAVASGGNPPYSYVWNDGTSGATRQICPSTTAVETVTVTDSAKGGEVPRPAESAQASVTAEVLASCSSDTACADVIDENTTGAPPPTCVTDAAPSLDLGAPLTENYALPFPLLGGASYEVSFQLTGQNTSLGSYALYGVTSACTTGNMLGSVSLQGGNAASSVCLHPQETYPNLGIGVTFASGNVTGVVLRVCHGCEGGM